jgi:hypothetical protein
MNRHQITLLGAEGERAIRLEIAELRASLQRQRLWNALPLAAVFAVSIFGLAGTPTDVECGKLRCRQIVVVDREDKARLIAECNPDGSAGVGWIDQHGKPRVMIDTLANGSAQFVVSDASANPRLMAKSMTDGSVGMGWLDKDGDLRIGATTFPDGTVALPIGDITPKRKAAP